MSWMRCWVQRDINLLAMPLQKRDNLYISNKRYPKVSIQQHADIPMASGFRALAHVLRTRFTQPQLLQHLTCLHAHNPSASCDIATSIVKPVPPNTHHSTAGGEHLLGSRNRIGHHDDHLGPIHFQKVSHSTGFRGNGRVPIEKLLTSVVTSGKGNAPRRLASSCNGRECQ